MSLLALLAAASLFSATAWQIRRARRRTAERRAAATDERIRARLEALAGARGPAVGSSLGPFGPDGPFASGGPPVSTLDGAQPVGEQKSPDRPEQGGRPSPLDHARPLTALATAAADEPDRSRRHDPRVRLWRDASVALVGIACLALAGSLGLLPDLVGGRTAGAGGSAVPSASAGAGGTLPATVGSPAPGVSISPSPAGPTAAPTDGPSAAPRSPVPSPAARSFSDRPSTAAPKASPSPTFVTSPSPSSTVGPSPSPSSGASSSPSSSPGPVASITPAPLPSPGPDPTPGP